MSSSLWFNRQAFVMISAQNVRRHRQCLSLFKFVDLSLKDWMKTRHRRHSRWSSERKSSLTFQVTLIRRIERVRVSVSRHSNEQMVIWSSHKPCNLKRVWQHTGSVHSNWIHADIQQTHPHVKNERIFALPDATISYVNDREAEDFQCSLSRQGRCSLIRSIFVFISLNEWLSMICQI